jgi:cyclopropane fatty-acyl-phospholipid synthase-like methyltransferase
MSTESDNLYQTGEYVRRNPTYHVEDSPWKARQIHKMMLKHGLAPQTICEIGCGAGEVLRQMQSLLPPETEFFGYEISPEAFALCCVRENQRLRFFHQDLLNDARQFDLLLCIDVFEHVEDYLAFLRGVRPRSAHKIFHIPLDLSVQGVLRSLPMREREQVGHLHYFTKDTALATLQDAGYTVVDWFYTHGAIAHPRSLKARLLAIWPRQLLFALNQDMTVLILGGYSLLVLAQ